MKTPGWQECGSSRESNGRLCQRGRSGRLPVALVLIILLSNAGFTFSQTSGESILQETGVTAGLCIVLGTGDGSVPAHLDNGGKILVHGLCRDGASLKAARDAIKAAGKQGLVSVDLPLTWSALPYAQNLAELTVVDLDELGASAPSQEEILRITAPGGVIYVKKSGAWKKTVKAVPNEMDLEFSTHEYDATGNIVSKDQLVGPSTSLQWISDYGWSNAWGVRLTAGKFFYVTEWKNKSNTWFRYMAGRSAWNGVSLWKKYEASFKLKMPFIAADGKVFTVLKLGSSATTPNGGPVVALDALTGEVRATFAGAGLINSQPMSMLLEYYQGTLLITNRDTLYACDAATGAVRWKFGVDKGKIIVWPTVAPDLKCVMVSVGTYKTPDNGFWGARFPNSPCDAVYCFDLGTGAQKWKNTAIDQAAGTPGVLGPNPPARNPVYSRKAMYRPIYHGGTLYMIFQVPQGDMEGWESFPKRAAAGVHEHGVVAAIRGSDGNLLWCYDAHYWFSLPVQVSMLWGNLNLHHYGSVRAFDPVALKRVGSTITGSDFSGDADQQCNRTLCTPRYMVTSSTAFYDRNHNILRQFITRGACADQASPGNGMLNYVSGFCNCSKGWLRGAIALSSELVKEPLAESSRLQKGGAWGQSGPSKFSMATYSGSPSTQWGVSTPVYPRFGGGTIVDGAQDPDKKSSPVRADWASNDAFYVNATSPVTSGGLSFVASVHNHSVEAKNPDGSTVWSYTVGGRVSSAPVVYNGLCLFGSHDGWVYCLKADDGTLVWRYMAAPNDRKIAAYGQIESAWPVYGLALSGSSVYYSAGRHPELDGGIWVGGLDPTNGSSRWRTVVRRTGHWRKSGTTGNQPGVGKFTLNNAVPSVSGGSLYIRGVTFSLSDGKMTSENPEYINTPFTGGLVRTPQESLRQLVRDYGEKVRIGGNWVYLPIDSDVKVSALTLDGKKVASVLNGPVSAGFTYFPRRFVKNSGAGRYILKLESGAGNATTMVTLDRGIGR